MLEPEEVDEGFFTPVASTTLANIFKSDSGIDDSINASLKYKPPQPKKTEPSPKLEDPTASHCVFSCSLYAYEWIQGTHKFKGKVGFAVMKMINSGICKIILYNPDKSTLSCTTMSSELQVTLKGAMITLYDDHKKYWGLCLNDNIIDKVKEILQQENVVIKHYESPLDSDSASVNKETEVNYTVENEMKTEHINTIDTNTLALKNDKASILSRIANVGHAILPSTHASPVNKSTPADKIPPVEIVGSTDRLGVMSDSIETSIAKLARNSTRSVSIQTSENNREVNRGIVPNNIHIDAQTPLPSLPIDNSQAHASVNGNTVQSRKFVPIITNHECGISASEIGDIINKLTHLQGLVKTIEIFETIEKVNNQSCPCKDKVLKEPNLEIDSTDNILEDQSDKKLQQIDTLEQLVREKYDIILNLQSELKVERMKTSDLQNEVTSGTKCLKEQIEDLKRDLIIKNEEFKNMIPRNEADIIIANTVKKLMNATFRSLASNFESDKSYSGSNVKGILATIIKKQTVESLSSLLPNFNSSNISSEPTE